MCKYVVVDLEMCRVSKQVRRHSFYKYGLELIQIGAVLVDESFNIIDSFNSYVSPQVGELDRFISKLTNITDKDINGAPAFARAMDSFLDWMPEDVTLVSWSRSDEAQIRREAALKGYENERLDDLLGDVIDCQKMFEKKIDINRAYNLGEALNLTDICQEERLHDGLADARYTAELFVKMMKNEKLFNSFYETAHNDCTEHLGTSLGNLLAGLNLSGCVA